MARIIVVDDSSMARKFHAFILSSLGFQVDQAEDGCLALEMLLREQFDLIVTDINMPRMDGFQFIVEARSIPAYTDTPIIIITTQEVVLDGARGLELGADVYFVKPTEPEKLVKWVKLLLVGNRGKEVVGKSEV